MDWSRWRCSLCGRAAVVEGRRGDVMLGDRRAFYWVRSLSGLLLYASVYASVDNPFCLARWLAASEAVPHRINKHPLVVNLLALPLSTPSSSDVEHCTFLQRC